MIWVLKVGGVPLTFLIMTSPWRAEITPTYWDVYITGRQIEGYTIGENGTVMCVI